MSKVYLLEHTVDNKPERMKIIGIFSSENDAKKAIEQLSNQQGFESTKDGFNIDEYELDKLNWTEGFVL